VRGRGEGSWSRLADGRWCYRVSVGTTDGKRKRLRFTAKTKSEAGDAAAEYIRDVRLGLDPGGGRQRLEVYLDAWLANIIRNPGTLYAYERAVRKHIIPRIGAVTLQGLTPAHVRKLQRDMLKDGYSAHRSNYARMILAAAMHDAERDGSVQRNVVTLVPPLSYSKKDKQPLTADQALRFIEHVADTRYGPLYAVAMGTGMRQGELLGLIETDIVERDGVQWIDVRRQLTRYAGRGPELRDLKTGDKARRALPLAPFALVALERQRERQGFERIMAGNSWDYGLPPFVFRDAHGRPLRAGEVREDIHVQVAASGLPPGTTFHDLRHSCATLLLKLGVDVRIVQVILGHTSIATTQIYASVLPELLTDAMGRLDGLLGGD
jgi:integrase